MPNARKTRRIHETSVFAKEHLSCRTVLVQNRMELSLGWLGVAASGAAGRKPEARDGGAERR
jgi:hypothetical protein